MAKRRTGDPQGFFPSLLMFPTEALLRNTVPGPSHLLWVFTKLSALSQNEFEDMFVHPIRVDVSRERLVLLVEKGLKSLFVCCKNFELSPVISLPVLSLA